MNLKRLSYYGRRLATARIGEPFWRLRLRRTRNRLRRRALNQPDAFSIDTLYSTRDTWLRLLPNKPIVPEIDEDLRNVFSEGSPADDRFWELFKGLYPEDADRLVQRAEDARNGRIQLFHWKRVDAGRPIRWSATFDETNPDDQWEPIFYADSNLHHDPAHPNRDVKWCWELNRFQHLLWFGAAWRITGEGRFADAARRHLEDWIVSVRYPMGIQWSSNLEVALRVLAWTRCHVLCLGSDSWDEEFTSVFVTALYREAVHLENELTLYHPPNNHLLGEASALLYLAACYPSFSDSRKWRTRSLGILKNLVPRLIHPDGVYGEQTTGYLRFIAEFLLPLMDLPVERGSGLPHIVLGRMTEAVKFIADLVPDGSDIPMIGDSDSGSATGWQLDEYWDFSFIRAAAAVLFNMPYLGSGIEEFPVESFLMLGIPGLESFQASRDTGQLKSSKVASYNDEHYGVRHFPQGGYQISRDSIFNIVFDAGPLGIYPAAGHGHADALSIILHYRGVPAVVDPGTYIYNGDPSWRNFFRSSPAHNTVSIDEGNQSETLRTFAWSEPLKVRQKPPTVGKGWALMQGSIEWKKALHVRYVLHLFDSAVVLLDHLDGAIKCDIQWSLNWAPEWVLEKTRSQSFSATSEAGNIEITTLSTEDFEFGVLMGSFEPMGGWHSRLYGSKVAAHTLRGRLETVPPASIVTCLRPAGSQFAVPSEIQALPIPQVFKDLLDSADFSASARRAGS